MKKMVDLQSSTVCSMCGDVGFPDKLFRCSKCCNRFQHSYCSNYYKECAEPIEMCDWCQCEEKKLSAKQMGSSSSSGNSTNEVRSAYSGDKVKQHDGSAASTAEKAAGKSPSPRQTTRRYKLLKDVMC